MTEPCLGARQKRALRKRLADFFAHLRPAALPCRFCQGAPVVTNNPDNHQPWSVHCARRGQAGHRGHNGNAVPGKTERGAVGAWNRRQLGGTNAMCKPHVAIEKDTRVFCKICGLSEPHECFTTIAGFQRHSDASSTSVGYRSRLEG